MQICRNCGGEFYCSLSQVRLRFRKHCSYECLAKVKGLSKVRTKRKKGESKQALQNLVNKYVRLRDCAGEPGAGCISCGKWTPFEKGDGGHFIAQGSSSALRYDERNINFQCQYCNRFKHGNSHNYYIGMVRKYGQEVVDYLMEHQHDTKKWSDEEIKALRKYYNERIKNGDFQSNTGLSVSEMWSNIQ